MPPRIALVHAVTVAIPPVLDSFRRLWPAAECVNLLDDSLSPDRERDGHLTSEMRQRIAALARYAVEIGADGVLFTCSAFGEAIEAASAEQRIPVLKPNEAMFEAALAFGRRVGMLATFQPSVASMEREFMAVARDRGVEATIETLCVSQAMAALKSGDGATHDKLLAEAAPRLSHCDVLLLAHFSTSRAEAAVASAMDIPVLTSPGSAVRKLKDALEACAGGNA